MTDNTASQRDQIGEVADSFVARFRSGERPSIEEFVSRYPELADELRKLLPALVMLEQHGSEGDEAALVGRRAFDSRPVPREIGEFTIVREIGRGGMGVVYEAVQQSLGRHVALKVLSSGSLLNPTHLERFRLEARSAGRLHHSHIVPVFGVGESDGLYYYAMQFIAGQSLDQVIEALRKVRPGNREDATAPPVQDDLTESIVGGLLSGQAGRESAADQNGAGTDDSPAAPAHKSTTAASSQATAKRNMTGQFSSGSSGRPFYESVARVGLQVAEALAYAHNEGILHRDIKPSNLILDAKGNTWVTDFGLVKADDTQSLTDTGDFVGTLRYMAPERLEGWSDRRSDIYGLGATLYELLTLHTFFEKANRAQLVDQVRHKQPESPTKIDPAVPRDLETIVLKALAKEPGARYHTADEMAEDLRRFLADQPILARRSTPRERFVRWCRRNPLVASLTATVAMLLIASLGILAISNIQIRRQAEIARAEAARSEQVAQFLKDMLSSAGPSVARGRDSTLMHDILERTEQRVERDLRDQPEVQGDLWSTLGDTYADIGDYAKAIHSLRKGIGSYRQSLGGDSSKMAKTLARLGRFETYSGDSSSGQNHTQLALEAARRSGDPATLASCLLDRAYSLHDSFQSKDMALPLLREAAGLMRELGTSSEALADCMMLQAKLILDVDICESNSTAEAGTLARSALDLYQRHVGPNHPKTIEDLFLVGQAEVCSGDLRRAEVTLREALDLHLKVHKKEHLNEVLLRSVLAHVLNLQGQYDEAISVSRKATEANVNVGALETAVLLLKNGREAEYREHCHLFLERAAAGDDVHAMDVAAKSAFLLPVMGEDFERACQMADAVETTAEGWMAPYACLLKSLAEYRRGRFDSTTAWSKRCLSAKIPGTAPCQAAAWFIQASACAHLHQDEAAQLAMSNGDRILARYAAGSGSPLLWHDWAIAEMLHCEAAKLLSQAD